MQEKKVLITGCSSGFGKYTAYFLRKNGWYVYAGARKEEDVVLLKKSGFDSFQLDLTSTQSIKRCLEGVLSSSGGSLTALVNNAGYTQIGAVEDLSREAMVNQFQVNVFGAVELTAGLIPVFRKQGFGRIVFISSVNGRFTFPFFGSYCASKYALESFSDALRRELTGTKIFVSTIEPGLFKTNAIANAREAFLKNVNSEKSVHSAVYKKIFDNFQANAANTTEEKSILVAKAVYKVLESRKPCSRLIVPKASLIYEMAARFLPDDIQDYLYSMKLKFLDKLY